MIHVGEQVGENLSISIENPNVLNIPRCTHDIPPMYSWIPQCTDHPPMYSWYPPTCIMISPDVLMVSPDVLNTPQCTHDIPPMYSYTPTILMIPPDVLNTHYTGWKRPLNVSFGPYREMSASKILLPPKKNRFLFGLGRPYSKYAFNLPR